MAAAQDGTRITELNGHFCTSFNSAAIELTNLTNAAVQVLRQLDERLLKEREQLANERAALALERKSAEMSTDDDWGDFDVEVAAVAASKSVQRQTTVSVTPPCTNAAKLSSTDETLPLRPGTPQAFQAAAALRAELEASDDRLRELRIRIRELEAEPIIQEEKAVVLEENVTKDDMAIDSCARLSADPPAELESYKPAASTSAWVSTPGRKRNSSLFFLADTAFQRPGNSWVLARQLRPGDAIMSAEGASVGVRSVTGHAQRDDFVRLRTADGSIALVMEQEILVEGRDNVTKAARVQKLRGWHGPLPRIWDGTSFKLMDCVELVQEQREVVELQFEDGVPIRAWTEQDRPDSCLTAGGIKEADDVQGECGPGQLELAGWVSVTANADVPRTFPSDAAFRRPTGQWVQAGQLQRNGGEYVLGPRGCNVQVRSANTLDESVQDFVRLRTMNGTINVPSGAEILVEGNDGKPHLAQACQLRSWAGPLPRVYDGTNFKAIDRFEMIREPRVTVEICFVQKGEPVLAWTFEGGRDGENLEVTEATTFERTAIGDSKISSQMPRPSPVTASVQIRAPDAKCAKHVHFPHLDEVVPNSASNDAPKCAPNRAPAVPNDAWSASVRVPLSVLFACSAPIKPQKAEPGGLPNGHRPAKSSQGESHNAQQENGYPPPTSASKPQAQENSHPSLEPISTLPSQRVEMQELTVTAVE
mmetsp:Transcript_20520/g.56972  ORF Transcript_20520/g.56972 Transcript_20520/m.56972 type:complete len:706 (-) Transcript_20520:86-2203(-)